MSAPGSFQAAEGPPADTALDWSTLAAALAGWWDEVTQTEAKALMPAGQSVALHPQRARAAQGLRDLHRALGGTEGSGSVMDALQALVDLVEDPQAPLPGSLATALVLTQDRLADLKLRKCLAARDPDWSLQLLQRSTPAAAGVAADAVAPVSEQAPWAAPVESTRGGETAGAGVPAPDAPLVGRNWWAVPVEGLSGSNQLFLIETRELLRSAELSLQALQHEPADYAEQMVLCRSFQAVGVAASSMGLSRLAAIAQEGEQRVDELLEGGGAFDATVLVDTDCRLQQLFLELMDLVGETVPAALLPPLHDETPKPALPAELLVEESFQAAEPEPPLEEALPVADEEPPAPTFAVPLPIVQPPPAPRVAPWWWALDWSAWPDSTTGQTSEEAGGASALADPLPGEGSAAGDPVMEPLLRLAAGQVQGWVAQLLASGHDGASRQLLAQRMEDATCVPLESWSVTLFRTARRVARERGRTIDFDIEGVQHRLDPEWAHRVMPILEQWVASRIEQGVDAPLRLTASALDGGLRLRLGDGADTEWADEVCSQAQTLATWMAARGGALRVTGPSASAWELDFPNLVSRVPLQPVRAGAVQLHVPALWVVASRWASAAEVEQALQVGTVEHGGVEWPATQLTALIRSDESPETVPQWVFLQLADHRLALLVEPAGALVMGRPVEWPAALAALPARAGLWGVVRPLESAAGALPAAWPVTDPFALYERFGAAARVLARSRARRRSPPAA